MGKLLGAGPRNTEPRLWRLRDASLKTKIMAAFLVVAFIGCLSASAGIYYLGVIAGQVKEGVATATGLNEAAIQLAITVREAELLGNSVLQAKEGENTEAVATELDLREREFAETLSRIETLGAAKGLSFQAKLEPDLASDKGRDSAKASEEVSLVRSVAENYKGLMAQTREMIKARVAMLRSEANAKRRLAEFGAQMEKLESAVLNIVHVCEISFASNEETAKTQIQMGKATPEQLGEIIEKFYETDYPVSGAAHQLQRCATAFEQIARQFLSERDEKRLEEVRQLFESKKRESLALANRIAQRSTSDEIRKTIAAVRPDLEKLTGLALDQDGMFAAHVSALASQRQEVAALAKTHDLAKRCKVTISALIEQAAQISRKALAKSEQVADSGQLSYLIGGIAGAGLLLGVLLGAIFATSLLKPLKTLAGQADRVSKGDLNVNIDKMERQDELGSLSSSFALMVESLREQIGQMNEGVNVLSASASEIADNVARVASSISQATNAIAETSSTAEELRQTAATSSERGKRVTQSAQEMVQVSHSGLEATQATVLRMKQIREQTESIAAHVVQLGAQSEAVEGITASVQDIADQSNLLAVNASIEAARAGEQGKGFGVVATEIKGLADQSKQATLRIMGILQETRKWVNAVVMATEQAGKAVEGGLSQAVITEEAIQKLSHTVTNSAEAAAVIEASSAQQLGGTEQVSIAMANLEQAMRLTLEGSEQLRTQAESLDFLAGQLRALTEKFTV